MTQVAPSRNLADGGTLTGTFRQVLKKFQQRDMDDMLPAKIIAYDRDNNIATVELTIQILTTDGTPITRAQLTEVPVLAYGGGGFVINFPLEPDDIGWLKATDRDISAYLTTLQTTTPATERLHKFSDGMFIPDVVRNFAAVGDGLVIQTLDGASHYAIAADGSLSMQAGDAQIQMTPAGLYSIANATDEVLQIISDFSAAVAEITTTTTSASGTWPINNIAAFTALQARIDAMKL